MAATLSSSDLSVLKSHMERIKQDKERIQKMESAVRDFIQAHYAIDITVGDWVVDLETGVIDERR